MLSSREIANTVWLYYCIAKDYLNPGNIYLSRDLPHHDQTIPDRAPFSVFAVWVIENW